MSISSRRYRWVPKRPTYSSERSKISPPRSWHSSVCRKPSCCRTWQKFQSRLDSFLFCSDHLGTSRSITRSGDQSRRWCPMRWGCCFSIEFNIIDFAENLNLNSFLLFHRCSMQISKAEIQHSRVALIFFYKIVLVWIELPRNNFFFSISISLVILKFLWIDSHCFKYTSHWFNPLMPVVISKQLELWSAVPFISSRVCSRPLSTWT